MAWARKRTNYRTLFVHQYCVCIDNSEMNAYSRGIQWPKSRKNEFKSHSVRRQKPSTIMLYCFWIKASILIRSSGSLKKKTKFLFLLGMWHSGRRFVFVPVTFVVIYSSTHKKHRIQSTIYIVEFWNVIVHSPCDL